MSVVPEMGAKDGHVVETEEHRPVRIRQPSAMLLFLFTIVTIVAIGTWVVEEILAYDNRLRSTHCREFHYMKLCRPAYFVGTTQLLPHPGYE